jgi:hypothetical protein
VVVVEAAVGAASSRGILHVSGGGETSSLAAVPSARETIDVAVARIDDVVGDEPVDVVKLDVEGGEVEALRGMKRLLGRRPDLYLVVECNPGRLAAMGTSADELFSLLESEGFSISQVDGEPARLSPRLDLAGREYVDLVCVRGEARGRLPA